FTYAGLEIKVFSKSSDRGERGAAYGVARVLGRPSGSDGRSGPGAATGGGLWEGAAAGAERRPAGDGSVDVGRPLVRSCGATWVCFTDRAGEHECPGESVRDDVGVLRCGTAGGKDSDCAGGSSAGQDAERFVAGVGDVGKARRW